MSPLPPVAALRAFEAAARLQSFTKAADELCLTQSGISRHIRNLEDWFGLALFHRSHRAVTLTPEGEMYRRDLSDAFARIELATRRLSRSRSRERLNVHAYTTFATNWLIPHLRAFQESYPEIDVHLTASLRAVDFQRDDVHCAVRTGPASWMPTVHADRLYEPTLFPVVAPSLLEAEWPLLRPADLSRAVLLHSLARPDDWRLWLEAAGVASLDIDRGMKFEVSAMAYLAAEQGLGVAMAQDFLVRDQLQKGTLVRPFDITARSNRVYYLLSSPHHAGSESLQTFRRWLLELTSRAA